MEIKVERIGGLDLVRKACAITTRKISSKITLDQIYRCEHSPMRCSIFWVEMLGVPTFISVHLVRHSIGAQHFVLGNREDRGGEGDDKINRLTPINHGMLINAQELVNIARKRLCNKTHKKTIEAVRMIRDKVAEVDPDLAKYMVPECVYRKGCHEPRTCGWYKEGKRYE